MRHVTSQAIIYKLYKYSDRSAIALAFTPEHGKIKLFINRAYSKKGGIMTFTPGTVSYTVKETSDMHRFTSFNHDSDYYLYSQTPDITFRLHLLFDYYDNLYDIGQIVKVFWNLCLRFSATNYKEITVYTIYRLLVDSGIMFKLSCDSCGATESDMILHNGVLICNKCRATNGKEIGITTNTLAIIQKMPSNDLYRDVQISSSEEMEILKLFSSYLDHVTGKKDSLKSFKVLLSTLQY